MAHNAKDQPSDSGKRAEPVVLPDVATQPHPLASTDPMGTGISPVGEEQLQEIEELAKKVGGIAKTPDEAGK